MAELVYFDADADKSDIVTVLREDGACVLRDAMDDGLHKRLDSDLGPLIEATPTGRDDFSGRLTGRTGALVARSEASRELVMHPTITDLARDFLGPFTEKIQLHLTQIINIQPGQGAQPRHRDRLAWGGYLPAEIEPQFNTIWALTDFTEETVQPELFLDQLTGPKIAGRLTKKPSKRSCLRAPSCSIQGRSSMGAARTLVSRIEQGSTSPTA